MNKLINVADLDSGNGKTYRQVNSEMVHSLKVGDLVELENGIRLMISKLTRDCDETPLYNLGLDVDHTVEHGYAEESLIHIPCMPMNGE